MAPTTGETAPLRRRRHGGGGNPNEPDEGEHESCNDGAYYEEEEERKVHGTTHSSLPLFLQKAFSLRNADGLSVGGDTGNERVPARQRIAHAQRERNAHAPHRQKLSKLDSLIESRDWSAVSSLLHPTGEATADARIRASASRVSDAPAFYDGHYGTSLLPLHRACMYDPTPRAIEVLVSAYPDGPTVSESAFDRLPLHMACRSNASIGAVRTLLRSNREAARHRDRLGRIPLHYCLANGANLNVVGALIDAYGDGLSVPDEEGWLPLHVACGVGVSRPVVKALVRRDPRALLAKTRRGSTPLDCARLFVGGKCANDIATLFDRTMDERRFCVLMEEVVEEEEEKEREEEGAWVGATPEGISRKTESFLRPRSRFEHRRKRAESSEGLGCEAGGP